MVPRIVAGLIFTAVMAVGVQLAAANHGHHHHGYYGPRFGFGVAVGPQVIVPPPVVVAPAYAYPPVYAVPAPAPIMPAPPVPMMQAPAVVVPPPPPSYGPTYSYGIMGGPRGVGFGYSSPGFGVYVGR